MLRVDSHQHFWQLNRGDYHWLNAEPATINRDFLPQDLQPLLRKNAVDYTVIVQAAETVEETDYILELANTHPFVAGVVGWVDMNSPASIKILERLGQHPKLVGIRPVIQGIADPNWMLKPELDTIFKYLIDNDLSFDALVKPIHLDALYILLQRYPELRVVIDHGAKPDIASDGFNPWAEKIQKISEGSHAFCKISGLVTEAGASASYAKLYPYMNHLVSCFGAHRLMWGSDWPVCTLAATYDEWIGYLDTFLKQFSLDEQKSIWGESAVKFYKLGVV
ncbi:amidohydrolase family protein [Cellvibrio zantedeschiae]|nr:amidohydrolase family protein [Cellvibrio zantedeschiae]